MPNKSQYLPSGPEFTEHLMQQQMEGESDPAPAAPFDPDAFFLRFETALDKRVNALDRRIKAFEKPISSPPPDVSPVPPPPPDPDGKAKDPHIAGLELKLKQTTDTFQKRLDEMTEREQKAQKKADDADRLSLVRAKLSKMNLREDAFDDAVDHFATRTGRSEDGSLVAGDLPFEQYIETQLTGTKAYMVKPKDTVGSGASAGQRVNGKVVSMESIRPGMSKEETQAAMSQIAAAI